MGEETLAIKADVEHESRERERITSSLLHLRDCERREGSQGLMGLEIPISNTGISERHSSET